MEIIEFDRWKPSLDDPRKLEYAGQRTAAEVFSELKHRLEVQGYLPDEYFEMRDEWKAVSYTHLTLPTKLEV